MAMAAFDYGEHDDGSPGSQVALSDDGHLLIQLQHPHDHDDSMDAEQRILQWVTDKLGELRGKTVSAIEVRQQYDYWGELDCQSVADALALLSIEQVTCLYWGYEHSYCFVEIPSLRGLVEPMVALESLTLQGLWVINDIPDGARGLRHLGLCALDAKSFEDIATLDLSRLESLELWVYDHENEGADPLALEDLIRLFDQNLPHLRELTVQQCEFGTNLVLALAGGRFLPQLESLRLLHCTDNSSYLSTECAQTLLCKEFSHLKRIDVTGSFSHPHGEPNERLQALLTDGAPRVYTQQQL